MKELIVKYLNKNYRFTLSTYVSYMVECKLDKSKVRPDDVIKQLIPIFSINLEEMTSIFDEWADNQAVLIQNKITDIRYKIYEKTGFDLQLTAADLNKVLEELENEAEEGLNHLDNELRIPIP